MLAKSASTLRSITDLAGKRIAVVAGTTNEAAINRQVQRRRLDATVLPFKSRDEALAALEEGKVEAFASDRLLLVGAATKAKDPRALTLLPDQLSLEPYAIALPHNDAAMRLMVNTALSQVYAGDEIDELLRRWFGALGRPSTLLEAVYALGVIPE